MLEVLLGAAEVEDAVWVMTLGSVEGMGFPSLVCSFTTWRGSDSEVLLAYTQGCQHIKVCKSH